MELNFENNDHIKRAQVYLESLIKKEARVSIKEKRDKRTINQNAYLHVCFGLFCNETGYTIEEAKIILKREYGLVYEKNGNKFLRSTRDLDTLEMTNFIEWIRNVACFENLGVYVPTPEEYLIDQREIDISLAYLM